MVVISKLKSGMLVPKIKYKLRFANYNVSSNQNSEGYWKWYVNKLERGRLEMERCYITTFCALLHCLTSRFLVAFVLRRSPLFLSAGTRPSFTFPLDHLWFTSTVSGTVHAGCSQNETIANVSPFSLFNPYPTAFPYGNGMVLHFYQQQESSTTKTVHKVINKGLKTYV